MLNGVRNDLHRTLRTGRMIYILVGSIISIFIMYLMVHFFPGKSHTIAGLFCAGTSKGFFTICMCLFIVSMIVVDYEYGNIKNICSVTKKRSDFILSKLLYAYILSFIGSVICMAFIVIAASILFRGQVTIGNPFTIIKVLISYSLILDFPLTIMTLFAMKLKRAAYCTYVIIALYFLPGIVYSIIDKNLHIPIQKISVLNFAFSSADGYQPNSLMIHAALSILYTLLLLLLAKYIANHSDAL